ncbi:MAG: radical SAM protein [Candidatus Omnitrophota bacterium]
MNIMLTNFCNRNCPYCFAKDKLRSAALERCSFLSRGNLKIIINFLKKSKMKHLGIIGGEPTLHPQFPKIIDELLRQGFNLKIFSNALFNAQVQQFLFKHRNKPWIMLANINPPDTYRKHEWQRINTALRILHDKVLLGFNISRINFNADFLIPLIKKHHLPRSIRLGVASPIVAEKNEYIAFNDHPRLSSRIVRFAEQCDKENISIRFDCGFALCNFSEQQLGKLFYCNAKFSSSCGEVIDVGPDLSVWRCFPLSAVCNKKLTDFKNLQGISLFYARKFMNFRKIGATQKCRGCRYLARRQCSGGCLAHIMNTFYIPGVSFPAVNN